MMLPSPSSIMCLLPFLYLMFTLYIYALVQNENSLLIYKLPDLFRVEFYFFLLCIDPGL
jgi:hypothetical protein